MTKFYVTVQYTGELVGLFVANLYSQTKKYTSVCGFLSLPEKSG